MGTKANNTPPPAEGLATRFGAVRGYMIDHVGVASYTPVFIALDPALKEYEDKIRKWWNSRVHVEEVDEPVITRMERVVEVLKNARNLAA